MAKKLIKLPQVMSMTALSRPTIYNYMKDGRFPRQAKLGPRNVAWNQEEVEAWIVEKLNQRI
ncbi:AlpA family transcriptional regulator [Gallaecimonas kandeliae]|uniref:helix-turn-helix transcriptional regulator n=1 Tax=Gallaecimonas kandeliae TaxID=3029055 RepID=UPI0026493B5B|nr:AlpA family transcriptional regulator [Gallaecimonas kandeliae]WKE65788.1 AlpA family transcriptional regulator [Gallaecimonas kandeliae]